MLNYNRKSYNKLKTLYYFMILKVKNISQLVEKTNKIWIKIS